MAQGHSLLPNSYKAVEYIQATGTQYIDILDRSGTWNFDVTIEILPVVNSWNFFCGFSYWSDSSALGVYWTSAVVEARRKYDGVNGSAKVNASDVVGKKCRFVLNKSRAAIIDADTGSVIAENLTQYDGEYTASKYIRMFRGASNSQGYEKPVAAKMSAYKAFDENGVLCFDFIPCVRKADDEIGVYDLIGKQFYSNSGTGEFLIPT